MGKTINMQVMRYINLFSKISKVSPKHCFVYNSMIIFIVPKNQIQKAIGKNSENLKKTSEIIKRKIKVVGNPEGISDAERFIQTIISPIEFKGIEIDGNTLIINAGQQSKAMLIGRNKARLEEMKKIIKDYFGKELKIV